MARPTIASLQAEIKRLRARITVALDYHHTAVALGAGT